MRWKDHSPSYACTQHALHGMQHAIRGSLPYLHAGGAKEESPMKKGTLSRGGVASDLPYVK